MPVKKIAKKTITKVPSVTVETKKMSNSDCCTPSKGKCCEKLVVVALLVINTILLVCLMAQQKGIESMRVGGNENYKMLQEVFKSEGFKNQQAQQIQQALQMYKAGNIADLDATATQPAAQ